MTMLREIREPDAREAEENLRVIRGLMERSTKHSTFSGVSGVLAGVASIAGCLITNSLRQTVLHPADYQADFLVTWTLVICFAIGADYLLTKRRAAMVGKRILSHLGKQMTIASAPGLGTGVLVTLYFLQHGILDQIFPIWMLCYGIAVCAVGLFSQREVTYLGAAFLGTGAITLFLPPQWGLPMMAVAFGGFHIGYGILMGRKDGWA
ncbi:MAG TPA: hypothetical protein VKU00_27115 [Chthonomonadaceae bacterium]|nr:hypothetical protein [Chthonomonadaceae bacterium]